MTKAFGLNKDKVIDFSVFLWAISVALATLSQGTEGMEFSKLTYPVVFFPALLFVFVANRGLVNVKGTDVDKPRNLAKSVTVE